MEQHALNVTDVIEYLEAKKAKHRTPLQKPMPCEPDQKSRKASEFLPKCPACSEILKLREAIEDGFESILFCTCGYEYLTDVSIVDQQLNIKAKMQGKDPDFSVEELRAPSEERKRRRVICKTCDQLTSRNTCKACGCRIKHRTYYEILTCPKKKW
jgi:hypothetical protein